MRNAPGDRGPVLSLRRREGSNPLRQRRFGLAMVAGHEGQSHFLRKLAGHTRRRSLRARTCALSACPGGHFGRLSAPFAALPLLGGMYYARLPCLFNALAFVMMTGTTAQLDVYYARLAPVSAATEAPGNGASRDLRALDRIATARVCCRTRSRMQPVRHAFGGFPQGRRGNHGAPAGRQAPVARPVSRCSGPGLAGIPAADGRQPHSAGPFCNSR